MQFLLFSAAHLAIEVGTLEQPYVVFGLFVSLHNVFNMILCMNTGKCILNHVLDDGHKNHISAFGIGTLHFAGSCFWCHAHGVPSCASCWL